MRALALGDDGALRDWVANESATRLAEARRDARLALARLEALEARLVVLGTPEYPAGLRDLKDPPAWLAVRGTLGTSPWRDGTAIVGSRDADADSLAAARALAGRVAAPIVSGLARGVDTAAHEGALAAGVATFAYVGSGLGTTYPPENAELAERIVAGGGALLSELLPDEPVTRWSLVRRDRLQAAHASALVLVQSEADGGAMHAVRVARELGRARFAFVPRAGDAFAGNVRALSEGATAVPWEHPTETIVRP
jgi:DNA processing protein